LNVAVTLWAALIVTTHVPVPEQPAPDQPPNVDPEAGAAVRVTDVPVLKDAEQVEPQLMPAGALVTVPEPVPARVTVSVLVAGGGIGGVVTLNVAVTSSSAFMVNMQFPVPEHPAPDQPANVDPELAVPVRVTGVPVLKDAVQVVGQLIPAGPLITVPVPVPVSVAVSSGSGAPRVGKESALVQLAGLVALTGLVAPAGLVALAGGAMEAIAVAATNTVAQKAIKADRSQVAEGELRCDWGTGPATRGALAKPTVWRSDPARQDQSLTR
jgi:hypothetical protein